MAITGGGGGECGGGGGGVQHVKNYAIFTGILYRSVHMVFRSQGAGHGVEMGVLDNSTAHS